MTYFIIEFPSINLVRYQANFNINDFKLGHIAFPGALTKQPYDSEKVILISDPYGNHANYYEFESTDIGLVEKLPNVINSEGEDFAMVLLWVKRGGIAVRSSVFIVEPQATYEQLYAKR